MHIRLAVSTDLPTTADISAAAFLNDELYEWMFPHRLAYPSHFRASFLRRLKTRFWSPNYVFYIAETDADDKDWSGVPQVVGYAVWSRRGDNDVAKSWRRKQDTWRARIEGFLLSIEECYLNVLKTDKSLDYAARDGFLATAPEEFEDIDDMWKLHNLATDPGFQHRGVGGMLIEWGQEQARREETCVCLTASIVGQGVYRKRGFRMYGLIPCEGFIDVPMMIWEPEGKVGAWGTYRDGREKGATVL